MITYIACPVKGHISNNQSMTNLQTLRFGIEPNGCVIEIKGASECIMFLGLVVDRNIKRLQ